MTQQQLQVIYMNLLNTGMSPAAAAQMVQQRTGEDFSAPTSQPTAPTPAMNPGPDATTPPAQSNPIQQVQDSLAQLKDLKQQVLSGKMSVVDFQAKAEPIVKETGARVGQIAGQGQGSAQQVNPIWQQFQDLGFAKSPSSGVWALGSPFSKAEYAALPDNVLPTQADISKGVFDPASVPIQRIQTPTGSTTAPITSNPTTPATLPGTGANGQPTSPLAPGQNLPGITPALPPGIDTSTDKGQIALQGAQNAAQLQDALNKQYGVNQAAVSQLAGSLGGIPDIYRKEGMSQQGQLNALNDTQKSARAQSLTDLAGILATNQQNLFNRSVPDLAEQANTKGIYQSTGFGNILADKYKQLTQDTQTQLAQQDLSDRNAYLSGQSNALNTQLGFSGQAAQAQAAGQQTIGAAGAGALQSYGAGLGDVANAQIGMQNAGLQRQFSLSDYSTQYANALNLANSAKTQGPTGKASPGTQAGIQTGVAAVGAANTANSAYKAA